jgi:hypothetical protein
MTSTTLRGAALLLPLAAMFCSPSARAAESYDNCTGCINRVPTVITAQSNWCFSKDLVSSVAPATGSNSFVDAISSIDNTAVNSQLTP